MLEECVKRLRANIFLLTAILLTTYLAYIQRIDDSEFLREYIRSIVLLKIPEIQPSVLFRQFEDTEREYTVQEISEGVSAPRILAHWKNISPTTFYENYCGDESLGIQSQLIADDIEFSIQPSRLECEMTDKNKPAPALAETKSLDTCEYLRVEWLMNEVSKSLDQECQIKPEELPEWLRDLTNSDILTQLQAAALHCSDEYSELSALINYRIANDIGAHIQLEVKVNDGISEVPITLWFTDVDYSEQNYDGEVTCGLIAGSATIEPTLPATPPKTKNEHINNVLIMLAGKTNWPGTTELLNKEAPISILDFEKHYRRTLDFYQKQEVRLPSMNIGLSFAHLSYGSLSLSLVLLISSCSAYRRILAERSRGINFPWGLTAISEINTLKDLSAIFELFWFFTFYLLISAIPLVLIVISYSMVLNDFDAISLILMSLNACYAVYSFSLLSHVLVFLKNRKYNHE
jgi:hypothetical protein